MKTQDTSSSSAICGFWNSSSSSDMQAPSSLRNVVCSHFHNDSYRHHTYNPRCSSPHTSCLHMSLRSHSCRRRKLCYSNQNVTGSHFRTLSLNLHTCHRRHSKIQRESLRMSCRCDTHNSRLWRVEGRTFRGRMNAQVVD
jgi:hypothetical protein